MGKRILSRRRGAAPPRMVSPSHRHKGDVKYPVAYLGAGTVESLEHAPGRTQVLARVRFADLGEPILMVACEGMSVGQRVVFTNKTHIEPGNVTVVSKIPEGTPIFNIEARPNDGGKFCKTAGSAAEIVSHDAEKTVVRMPSGKFREVHPLARATIGLVAGGGRGDKPFLKAGKKHHAMRAKGIRWPRVRGVAMNPVDHPHGGGSHNFKGAPTSQARGTPPGALVGKIAPKRTGMRR
ncbi:MAG TPA: 50S ribosomal protein L2 [Candidatus Thermoplasmatota archaeon]|nr:50S ribosomal protein L2 [Candidatus Thermoplasmatota archaeon]